MQCKCFAYCLPTTTVITIATGKYLLFLLYACHTLVIGAELSVGVTVLEEEELDIVVVENTVLGDSLLR